PPRPRSTLFPYTTLFRSHGGREFAIAVVAVVARRQHHVDSALAKVIAAGRRDVELAVAVEVARGDRVYRCGRGVADRGEEAGQRSEEHTSELQSRGHLVC